MKPLKKIRLGFFVLIVKIIFLIPLSIFVIYGLMIFLGGIIPVNTDRVTPGKGEQIYLLNNGYHIALALPRDSCPYKDIFDIPLNISTRGGYYYFGWGDREFYLGTPTVKNIDWSMASKALFIPSSSILEVFYIHKILSARTGVSSLIVTENELSELYQYIKETIMKPQNLPEQVSEEDIDQAFFGSIFFEARGSYSLINTCNNWTSKGLKYAGLNTHLWTPLTWGVE